MDEPSEKIEVVSDGHVITVKDRVAAAKAHRWWIVKLIETFKRQSKEARGKDE